MSRIQLLEKILECVPLAIFAKDAKTYDYVLANKTFRECSQISDGELKNDYVYFPKEQADFFREKDIECLQNREMVFIPEEPVMDIFARTWKVPLLNEEGEPTHLLGIFEDITELVEVRRRAEELDRNRRRIAENLDVGFFLVSRDGKVLEGFTDSCRKLLGTRFKEGLDLALAAGLEGNYAADVKMAIEQLFEDFLPEEISLDLMSLQVENDRRAIELIPSPIRDDDGQLESVLYSVSDATALKSEQAKNEQNAALIQILRNIEAFRFLTHDVFDNLRLAYDVGERERRTILHTLKGNISQSGSRKLRTSSMR